MERFLLPPVAALAKKPFRVAVLTRKTPRGEVPSQSSSIFTRGEPMRPPVAPYLTVSPAMAAIAFYVSVFGAQQRRSCRRSTGCGSCIASSTINGGSIMLADAFPEFGHTRVPLPGELATCLGQPGICRGQDGRRYFREGHRSRRQGRDEPDEFVLGHAGRDISRSLRSSLDLERANCLKLCHPVIQSQPSFREDISFLTCR